MFKHLILIICQVSLMSSRLLFDYGLDQGDVQYPKGDTEITEIDLNFTFPYMNIEYKKILVTVNGYIGFKSHHKNHYISIYECPMSNKNSDGNLFYRYTENSIDFDQVQHMILNLTNKRINISNTDQLGKLKGFIITWANLKLQNSTETNTFQMILLSNMYNSFIVFSYGNLTKLEPKVSLRHSTNYVNLINQSPFNFDSTLLSKETNVNSEGVFIFEVNTNTICNYDNINVDEVLQCTTSNLVNYLYMYEISFCNQIKRYDEENSKLFTKDPSNSFKNFNYEFKCNQTGSFLFMIKNISDGKTFYVKNVLVIDTITTIEPTQNLIYTIKELTTNSDELKSVKNYLIEIENESETYGSGEPILENENKEFVLETSESSSSLSLTTYADEIYNSIINLEYNNITKEVTKSMKPNVVYFLSNSIYFHLEENKSLKFEFEDQNLLNEFKVYGNFECLIVCVNSTNCNMVTFIDNKCKIYSTLAQTSDTEFIANSFLYRKIIKS